ncbi:MAG: hypothetical protein WC389_15845 [Lutibacter sp.]|jgi:hypothetical protein
MAEFDKEIDEILVKVFRLNSKINKATHNLTEEFLLKFIEDHQDSIADLFWNEKK